MRLFNTLSKEVAEFEPTHPGEVRIYSCGPTVYERVHIGNLASFIYADTLRRALQAAGYKVRHVMNITDVDDKTIAASRQRYPDLLPKEALKKLTSEYEEYFKKDAVSVGINLGDIELVRATDNIDLMQTLISRLIDKGIAYVADDGVYFSINKYRQAGKTYGQLVNIPDTNANEARIDNDNYDKEQAQDFVLWKKQKPGEPAWDFDIKGQNLAGRPGWHIECSAMSVAQLGQPFDIHTGGVDLKFPHHENEIAQSTADDGDLLARVFFHNEHLLIDSQKMSKSLNNFYTLEDIVNKGFDPLAFRLFILEGKYSTQRDFSWQNLQHSANRLRHWRQVAGKWRQVADTDWAQGFQVSAGHADILSKLESDLNTPEALERVDSEFTEIDVHDIQAEGRQQWQSLVTDIEEIFGLKINERDASIEELLAEREEARQKQDWELADKIRGQLEAKKIGVDDTEAGPVWYRK